MAIDSSWAYSRCLPNRTRSCLPLMNVNDIMRVNQRVRADSICHITPYHTLHWFFLKLLLSLLKVFLKVINYEAGTHGSNFVCIDFACDKLLVAEVTDIGFSWFCVVTFHVFHFEDIWIGLHPSVEVAGLYLLPELLECVLSIGP